MTMPDRQQDDSERMTSDGDAGFGLGEAPTGGAADAPGAGADRDEDPTLSDHDPDHDPARGGSIGTTIGEVVEGGSTDTAGMGEPVGSHPPGH
jgi:hypothetical protein